MKIDETKDKIVEVWAVARVIVQKYGHTKKFAKHIVALTIKQYENLSSDSKLADFLVSNEIGRILGYKKRPHKSTFSKVRERSDPQIFKDVCDWIIASRTKGKRLRLVAQDSTDISAYSEKDKDARYGHRTPSKKEQIATKSTEKSFVFGYKLHMDVDAENDMPLTFEIAPANRNDKVFFHKLYAELKERFNRSINYRMKFLADAAYDSTDIYQELHYDNVKPLIAINGRGFYKSSIPKDKDYGKRWSVERVFSRLKEVFGLAKNRFVGMKKVVMHMCTCIIAYVVKYG